jgi:rubrerythrin
VRLYQRMKEKAPNDDLKGKMDFLIDQEKKHEKILTEVYHKRFPDVDLQLPPKAIVPTIDDALEKDADLKVLFDVAMKAEKLAEKFYTDLAAETRDSNAKSILTYMAAMERSHFTILEAEFKQIDMVKTTDAGEFLDSERLMTLGP